MEVESLIKIPWAIETDGALRVKPTTKPHRPTMSILAFAACCI